MVVVALFIGLTQFSHSRAASFNCGPYIGRGKCPESLICTERTLSRLDDTMAALFFDARSRMPDEHLTGFRDYQTEWLARRDQCGCNYQCLENEYREQIDALRRTLRGQ
jgi:uncharacterized protein